jgi:hypothetical protein
VGTGDRSEKIKTYNWKDSRVSDHRIKLNFDLNSIMDGERDSRSYVKLTLRTHVCASPCGRDALPSSHYALPPLPRR